MQKEIDNFMGEVVSALKINNLPKEAQEKIIADLGANMFEEILLSSLEVMSESDREEFIKIEETGDPEKITIFLNEKIPNFQNFARERAKLVSDAFINALSSK